MRCGLGIQRSPPHEVRPEPNWLSRVTTSPSIASMASILIPFPSHPLSFHLKALLPTPCGSPPIVHRLELSHATPRQSTLAQDHVIARAVFYFYFQESILPLLAIGLGTTTLPLLARSLLVFNPLAWLRPRRNPAPCNHRTISPPAARVPLSSSR